MLIKNIFLSVCSGFPKRLGTLAAVAVMCCTATAQVKTETPLMGWSSWNTYRVNISDSLIMRQADAMVEKGLKQAGYEYVNTDDGFFGGRDAATGRLLVHPTRFPRGLKPVVDHIHALGLKAGIYSDAGSNTCGNYYDNDTIAVGVGLYRHEQQDAEMFFKELGYDFIKIDDCGFRSGKNHERRGMDTEERYRAIHQAIESVRPEQPVRVNVCRKGYPGKWVYDVATSWRISNDIRPRWSSVRNIINLNLYLAPYARLGCYNDMDMLEVGRGMSREEDRTHFGMWCIMASPLLIGCDMTKLEGPTLELLSNKELIAINQDPLGLQAEVVCRSWADSTVVLVKDLLERNGTTRAVAFYNYSNRPQEMAIGLRELLLDGKVSALDVFSGMQSDNGGNSKQKKSENGMAVFSGGEIRTAVPAHGVRIYRLVAERRLEQTRYEAETAFLSAFQQLYNPIAVGTAFYERDSLCSGGMKVVNLGQRAKNDIVWENVYSRDGGSYELTVRCLSDKAQQLYVSVNDGASKRLDIEAGTTDAKIQIVLKPGQNTVRLFNDTQRMPDIDYMDIGPQDI